jgi:primosomal replication protein N
VNQVQLSARIAESSALRHTPAGIPAIDLTLEHESEQQEAGSKRQVALAVKAVAFGTVAESLRAQVLGSAWRFSGFLAAARGGKHPVLHIQSFESSDQGTGSSPVPSR